jgi:glycosyltransferase involved in cell wall biosynthesis
MRALIVHAGNLQGGLEHVLEAVLQGVGRYGGVEADVALVFEGPVADRLRADGVRVHVIGPARASRPWSLWRARRRLATLVASLAPDVIVYPSTWSLGLLGGVAATTGTPCVLWVHDPLGTGHWTERLAARRRPALLLCSSHFSARLATAVFPGVEHVVLYAPRAERAQSSAPRALVRDRHRTPADAIVIALVSRAEPWKGHRILVEALARLRDDRRWVCWLVSAPQRDEERTYWTDVERLVRDRGIEERVRLVGASDDVPGLMAAADIYCQPNLGPETFGLTFVEAMEASLPIVTSAIGAAPEVLEGTGSLLVPPGEPAAVADALRVLIGDEASRRRIGAAGPARARALTDPVAAHRVFVSALERAASGAGT